MIGNRARQRRLMHETHISRGETDARSTILLYLRPLSADCTTIKQLQTLVSILIDPGNGIRKSILMTRIARYVVDATPASRGSNAHRALRTFKLRTGCASLLAPAIFVFLLSIAVLQAQRPIPDDDILKYLSQ